MTIQENAHAVLGRLPEERVEVAAFEAAEGCDTSVEAILARHGKQRLDSKEFEGQFALLSTGHQG
ncbi:MAG TPA: hypothetical protein VFW48_05360 [Solirubrobacterales bacterium]|nr:hypothetical protein [Solirubrobacterales bacterium]